MSALRIVIPEGVSFDALRLSRDPHTGGVKFDWTPIELICQASGIDIAAFRDSHEDNVSGLIVEWYVQHLARGGARDPVQDELLAEIAAEDERGGGSSHTPGRA